MQIAITFWKSKYGKWFIDEGLTKHPDHPSLNTEARYRNKNLLRRFHFQTRNLA